MSHCHGKCPKKHNSTGHIREVQNDVSSVRLVRGSCILLSVANDRAEAVNQHVCGELHTINC